MDFEQSSTSSSESEKEWYERLDKEMKLLIQNLYAIESSIVSVSKEKSPIWRRRRWRRIKAQKLDDLKKQRIDISKSHRSLHDLRAKSNYGRMLQSEKDKLRSKRQSERDKARNARKSSAKNSSKVSDARAYYYDDDDDDDYSAPSLDELAKDWGYGSWGEFGETID
jgi:hypothetical protein